LDGIIDFPGQFAAIFGDDTQSAVALGDDGISEGAGITPRDSDNDGRADFRDVDSDNDSISDTDLDGALDAIEVDADADGISDLLENGGVDVDGDGRIDNLIDENFDGIDDTVANFVLAPQDTDNEIPTMTDHLIFEIWIQMVMGSAILKRVGQMILMETGGRMS